MMLKLVIVGVLAGGSTLSRRRMENEAHAPTPAVTMPRLVLTYAKKVLSDAKWSRATLPEFFNVRETFDINA